MRTPASIAKHPIHPMLIVFPIGLWIFSLVCDLIHLAGAPGDAWLTVASHMTINLTVVVLYAINIWLRASEPTQMGTVVSTPVLLSIIGVALLFVSGWLGGQMVHVYGVGVEGRE
jgi:uncharacterized membrane protein